MTTLGDVEFDGPVLVAPLAGGPSTPALVVAARTAGSFGFLAGGYQTAAALAADMADVRGSADAFGVNLFGPNPVPVDPADYRAYRGQVQADADRFGVALPEEPVENDDDWHDKIEALLADPVPVVSFTFGVPQRDVVDALHRAGSLLMQTVTSTVEAGIALDAGIDVLVVQASAAGGHSGTLTPETIPAPTPLTQLLAEVGRVTDRPLLAAGGIADAADVAAALSAGAYAVMIGTAVLLAPEAGTSAAYRAALLGPDRGPTLVTRAFTGRPARAMPNAFTAAHHEHAPAGYPALHYLTRPLRRASAAAVDPEFINLWAGTGYRSVRERPVADTIRALTG